MLYENEIFSKNAIFANILQLLINSNIANDRDLDIFGTFLSKMESFGTITGRCAAPVRQLLLGGIWGNSYFYTKTCYFMQTIFVVRLGR